MIVGTYRLPAIKQTFFVYKSTDIDRRYESLIENRKYFEYILLEKDKICANKSLLLDMTTISENHFLSVIKKNAKTDKISSIQPLGNSEMLQMLSINISKNSAHLNCDALETPKFLSPIPTEDVIEVFI